MKRFFMPMLLALLPFVCIAADIGADEEQKDGIYKEVMVNGEMVGKWLKVLKTEEYDATTKKIFHIDGPEGKESVFEYDDKKRLIHGKDADGNEYWHEYDKKGNEIHYRNTNGEEWWKEYDSKRRVIYEKNHFGEETWYEYDKKGRISSSRNAYGEKFEYEYVKGEKSSEKNIYQIMADGTRELFEQEVYNKYGMMTYSYKGGKLGEEIWNQYDLSGKNLIYSRNSHTGETWNTYDKKGQLIKTINPYGEATTFEYDKKGRLIHKKEEYGRDITIEYDKKGRIVHYSEGEGTDEYWVEYVYGPGLDATTELIKQGVELAKGMLGSNPDKIAAAKAKADALKAQASGAAGKLGGLAGKLKLPKKKSKKVLEKVIYYELQDKV